MVKAATLALSGAAFMATASSFMVPPAARPTAATAAGSSSLIVAPMVVSPKLPSSVGTQARSIARTNPRRRGRWAMSSTTPDVRDAEIGGGERYYGPISKPLLDSVHSPADMKRFSVSELKQLAYELRWETLEVCCFLLFFSGFMSSMHARYRWCLDRSLVSRERGSCLVP